MSQEPSSSQLKRRQKVERASLFEVKHFLCYFCGDFFPNLLDYQKHILNHQLYAYSYQIWHGRQHDKNRKKRQIEKSEQVTPSVSPQPSSTVDKELDQKEENAPVAKKRENAPNVESLSPKTVKRRKTTSREEKEEQISPNESKKKMEEFMDPDDRPRSEYTETSTRTCDVCPYTCNKFSSLIAHQVEVHQAEFYRITMFLFVGNTMHAKKISPPGPACPRCSLKFINDSQYYLHLLSDHVAHVAHQLAEKFEEVDNQDTEVILNRPNEPQISYTYNIPL